MRSLLITFTIFLLAATQIQAADYYISPSGSDSNPGTQSQPFATLQQAINSTSDNDVINIKSGTYDLNGRSLEFSHALTILGEDKNTTIITNGNPIVFHNSLTVKNLKFTNWRHDDFDDSVFRPEYGYTTQYGNYQGTFPDIDGITLDNLIIDNAPSFIRSHTSEGYLTNVTITNNQITNIQNDWSVYVISLSKGHLSYFTISNNSLENIATANSHGDAIPIFIGNDSDFKSNPPLFPDHITVENNTITNIRGGWVYDPNYYFPATRGIMVYGDYVSVRGNHISEIQTGDDKSAMNCIYIKSSHSFIENNILHNCGSNDGGSGALTIKGDNSVDNLIRGNTITGDQFNAGSAIYSKGQNNIEDNYINFSQTNYNSAIFAYDLLGKNFHITGNQIAYNNNNAIYIWQADQGEIAYNNLVSNNSNPIYLNSASNLNIHDNTTCHTYNDCPFSPPPTSTSTPTPSPSPSPSPAPDTCPADIYQDGFIDITDFSILSANFLSQNPSNPRADIYKDGIVDLTDFSILSRNFLTNCP